MSFYRLDRFAAGSMFPVGTTAFQTPVITPATPIGLPLSTALHIESIRSGIKDAAQTVAETHATQTDQQQADAQLQALLDQQRAAQQNAAVAQAEDPGQPPSTSPLVYVGLGVGALVLVGGAFMLGKPKKKLGRSRR